MGSSLRSAVAVVGERRTAQRHPEDRPGVQNEPNTCEAHPRPRVHCSSHTFPPVVGHPVCHA